MITLIHGDDIASSRNFFLEQRKNEAHSLLFDGETLELSQLVQILEGGSLFEESKKIYIENLLSKKSSKSLDEIISYLKKHEKEHDIYVWERKELTKKQTAAFAKPSIKTFKLPQSLFAFLDSLRPRNSATSLSLLHKTLESVEPELVFFMILRQLRLLLSLSDTKSAETIDEVNRMAPWQKSKLQRQAKAFSFEKLIYLYKKLYEIDVQMKTGKNSLSLVQAIDILLLNL